MSRLFPLLHLPVIFKTLCEICWNAATPPPPSPHLKGWQPAGHNFLHKWPIIGRVDEQRAAPYGGKWAELESANREGGLVLVSDIEEEQSPSRTTGKARGKYQIFRINLI